MELRPLLPEDLSEAGSPDIPSLIDRYADEYGVPKGLARALFKQESNFNPKAVNTETGATGLGQLMPATAGDIDRTDPEANVKRSLQYLREGFDKRGNLRDALHYYYGGPDTAKWGPKTRAYPDQVLRHTDPADREAWSWEQQATLPGIEPPQAIEGIQMAEETPTVPQAEVSSLKLRPYDPQADGALTLRPYDPAKDEAPRAAEPPKPGNPMGEFGLLDLETSGSTVEEPPAPAKPKSGSVIDLIPDQPRQGPPLRPEVSAAIERAMADPATAERLMAEPGAFGQSARLNAPAVQARVKTLYDEAIGKGATPEAAKAWAERNAESAETAVAAPTDFDFDTAKRYEDANVLTRAAVKSLTTAKQQVGGVVEAAGDIVGADTSNVRAMNAQYQRALDAIGDERRGASYLESQLEGALTSIGTQGPQMVYAVLGGPGSAAVGLGSMFMQQAGQEYTQARAKGFSQGDALERAGFFGTAEVLGETVGLPGAKRFAKALLDAGVETKLLVPTFGKYLAKENAGEQVTTGLEFGYDKLSPTGFHQDATMADYLRAVMDTGVQTTMQTLLTGAAGKVLKEASGEASSDDAEAAKEAALAKWGEFNDLLKSAPKVGTTVPNVGTPTPSQLKEMGLSEPQAAKVIETMDREARKEPEIARAAEREQVESNLAKQSVGAQDSMQAATREAARLSRETGEKHRARLIDDAWHVVNLDKPVQASTDGGQTQAVDKEVTDAPLASSEETQAETPAEVAKRPENPQATVAAEATNVAPKETNILRESKAEDTVDAAAHEAATSPQNEKTEPTDAQKEAGNYAKGHATVAGLDISIENPEGSKRRPEWPELKSHYGYIRRSTASDGDHVDTFIKPGTPANYAGPVFVVDQVKQNGAYDEPKVMIGWPDEASARQGYLENYTPSWKGLGAITKMELPAFKAWVYSDAARKPVALKERRGADPFRKRVASLTPEERAVQLLTSHKVGIPNFRAFDEDEELGPAKHYGYADGDNFRMVNQILGHDNADLVMREMGRVFQEAAQATGAKAYHRSGDEFLFRFESVDQAAAFEQAAYHLAEDTVLHFEAPDGKRYEFQNPGFSFGAGPNRVHAETAAELVKQRRRAARTAEQPVPGLSQVPAQGNEVRRSDAQEEVGKQAPFARNAPEVGKPTFSHLEIEALGQQVVASWVNGPNFKAIRTLKDAPAAVQMQNERMKAKKAAGRPYAFLHEGTIYVVTSEVKSAERLFRGMYHEGLGHYGLRGLFGDKLDSILAQIVVARRGEVTAKAQQYGLDMGLREERLLAAEEVLVDMAETKPELGFVRRAIAAIRSFLRPLLDKMGIKLTLTDDEILRSFIIPARGWVERGHRKSAMASAPVFQRDGPNDVFYSELARQVSDSKTENASASQWIATLKGLKGVKADELVWSGVLDWLATREGKVRKSEVEDFLAQNGVRIEEVMLGGDSDHADLARRAAQAHEKAQALFRNLHHVLQGLNQVDRANVSHWALAVQDANSYADEREHAQRRLNALNLSDDARAKLAEWAQATIESNRLTVERSAREHATDTRFETYTLPGGENYRELLLTLPPRAGLVERANAMREVEEIEHESAKLVGPNGHPTDEKKFEELTRRREALKASLQSLGLENFRSSHFDTPNILAHVRFKTRTDADGKKVLFIEEFQSDWAQKGKREGFATGTRESAAERLKAANAAVVEATPAAHVALDRNDLLGFDSRNQAINGVIAARDDWRSRWEVESENDAQAIERLADAVIEMRAAHDEVRYGTPPVPAAPFVGKTEAWLALAVKRMIRYAAEHGYDRVAWTTGEQQAERYDLSKQVAEVNYQQDRGGWVIGFKDHSGKVYPSAFAKDEHALEEFVGKELAKRILNNEGRRVAGTFVKVFDGLDLKIGGEGMRAFYDRIVPNVVNDVLKKLGGGRVATVPLRRVTGKKVHKTAIKEAALEYMAGNLTPEEFLAESSLGDLGVTVDELDDSIISGTYSPERRRTVAQTFANDMEARFKGTMLGAQPGFEVTPEMKARAMGGLALFARADSYGERHAKLQSSGRRLSDVVSDLFHSDRTFNAWHRTIGTQYHKAQIDPDFKRVYDRAQDHIREFSQAALEAAERAPTLLPKIDGLAGVVKSLTGSASQADIAAVAKPILDGTLESQTGNPHEGRVWSDQELKVHYLLDDKQIALYREFRAAVDHSLDLLHASEVANLARNEGVGDAIEAARQDPGKAGQIVGDALSKLAEGLKGKAKTDKLDLATTLHEKLLAVQSLKDHGYAPLMRFGKWSVSAYETDPETGEESLTYFSLHESRTEANAVKREVQRLFPGAKVVGGVKSEDSYQLYQGLTPDTLELFAHTLGVGEDSLFQQYLKVAKNSRSAFKRLIHRKGTAGFEVDPTRTLAAFITSNARAVAGNWHMGEMVVAADSIPKDKGDVRDEATALVRYLQNPNEKAAALRGYLFIQYLGGSISAALVNMTQPLAMTYPYLAQYGAKRAATALTAGMAKATSNRMDEDTGAALHRAEEAGIVAPHEVHMLHAEAMRSLGANLWTRRLMTFWGSLFAAAEAFNRRSTFIAAYDIARDTKVPDPYRFAVKAVEETQGVYNRGNRPNWARGTIGATIFTFKQFAISHLEFLKRLPPQQKALALAVLFVMAGLEGLPFAEDVEDLLDTIAQALGYSFNSRQALRKWATETLGTHGAQFLLHGASHLPGVPLDVQGRLGMGNLIPGSSAGKLSADAGKEALDVLGPAGSLVKDAAEAAKDIASGDVEQGLKKLVPKAIQNVFQAVDMWRTGMYRDSKGRKVKDTDTVDAAVKAVGFQPQKVAIESKRIGEQMQNIQLHKKVEGEIAEHWARARFELAIAKNDAQREVAEKGIDKARKELADWNEKNPDARIVITPQQIQRRVREMQLTREQRVVKQAPREMRSGVREELQ